MTDHAAPTPSFVSRFRAHLHHAWTLLRLGFLLAWWASPGHTLGLLALMVIDAIAIPVQLTLTAITIDSIIHELDSARDVSRWARHGTPMIWIALLAIAVLLVQVLDPLRAWMSSMLADRTTVSVGDRLLETTNRWQGVGRFEDPATADDLSNAAGRAANAGNDLLMQAAPIIPGMIGSITLSLALAAVHPVIPLLVIAASLPHLVTSYAFMDKVYSSLLWQTADGRRLRDTRDMPIRPDLAPDVHLFGLGDRLHDRYEMIWRRNITDLHAIRTTMMRSQLLWTALKYGAMVAAMLYVVWQATRGAVSIGEVTLFTGALFQLSSNLAFIGSAIGFIPRILTFLPVMHRVLGAGPDLPIPAHPAPLDLPLTSGFAFRHVTFAYPGSERPVLDDVSFTLDPGESLALVGHNGAGKTTIVKLMLRLYDPDAGQITLNGVDLRDYDPVESRRACSVIFQDFGQYDFTARENIALGDITVGHPDADLMAAAEEAGADDVIGKLPDGLDTMLGLRFGGRDLSGGEWQKLALSRAFIRDAPVLILDEPTAALDVRSEHEVYQRFATLTRDKATMLISHRFSTVRMAERILVLDGARVAESGSHEELMRRRGVYHRLYTAQAQHYVEGVA